jgi:hypothetical protein
MKKVVIFVLPVTAILMVPVAVLAHHEVTVGRTSLDGVARTQLATKIESTLSDITARTFPGPEQPQPLALYQFAETAQLQAERERWSTITVQLWAGGVNSAAGYFIKIDAADSAGDPVESGAFVAADKSTVSAIMRENGGELPYPMREVSY